MDKPYLGLRPYTEQDKDYFFGRENDRRILTDKILSNRLTLLFAASGVGKSSLLRASVLPYLQHPQHKNLDVVYCNDWVVDPIHSLQQHTLEALILSGSLATDMTLDKLESNNLNEFFQFCALFTRQPLVIILDQFEEFFLYNKHTKEFKNFINQFSIAISDPVTPITVVISMREDFAMELNYFKAKLSTLLFENFYRLDKLTLENARQAIIDPVEKIGFQYEEGLVDELLNDFAIREVIGDRSKPLPELIDTVEPAYLQIVCSQLWDLDKNNPDKILTRNSYTKSGRATGLLKSYVESVISHFSENEKKIASKAFDHLVSRYGTKVAYTAADLSPVIRIKQSSLERVLQKLDKARILRSQSREGIVWYELHHDLFSKSVGEWNQNFKAKQLSKRAILVCMGAIAGGLLLFAAYDYGINSASHHLRLSTRSNDNEIELYHGRQDSRDLFGIQKYIAQTGYQKGELEPDKVFTDRAVGKLEDLDVELIEHLQRFKRFERYMQTGKFVRAEKLIKYYLDLKDYDKVMKLTEVLPSYPTQQGIDILQSVLTASNDNNINRFVIQKMGELPSRKTAKILTEQMSQMNPVDENSLRLTLSLLGQFGYEESFPALVEYLNHFNPALRQTAFNALKTAEHPDLHKIIKQLLKDANPDEKVRIIDLLSKVGTTVEGGNFRTVILEHLSPEQPSEVRITALKALQNTQHNEISATLSELIDGQDNELKIEAINILKAQKLTSANEKLVTLLTDNNADVRDSAADALASLSNKQTTPLLIKKLDTLTDDKAIIRVIEILGEIGGSDVVNKLLSFQQTTQRNDLKIATIKALGKIDNEEIILPLSALLSHRETAIRTAAENALGNSKHKQATKVLTRDFNNFNTEKFHLLKLLLDKQETDALRAVLKLLAHKEYEVRLTVLLAFGEFDRNLQGNNIDQDKIAEELISLLNQPHWPARNNAMSAIADRNFFNLEKLQESSRENLIAAIRSQVGDGKPWIEEPVTAVQERRFMMNYARALGKLNQADAIPALIDLKLKGEKLIGEMAEKVLENMQGMEVNGVLFSYLDNHDPKLRRYALELLKGKKDISFPPSLIGLIDSKDSEVRSKVVSILSMLARSDEKSYGEILITQLKSENNPQVQQSIIQSLNDIRYKEALPTILTFFNNAPSALKRSALAAASQLGDSSIRPALLNSLEDNDQDVRYDSAVALAKLNNEPNNEESQQKILPILREQLRDLTGLSDVYDVQQTYQLSNQQTIHPNIKETKPPENKDNTNQSRINDIIRLLGKAADQESIDLLRELVDKKDMSAHRKFIIKALAESKDPQAIDLFIDGLYGDNSEVYIETLKKINSSDLIQKLADRLGNPDLRIQRITINTLGSLSDPRALPVLLEQLDNTKAEIQLASMEALSNIGDHHAERKLLKFLKEKNQGLRNSAINALGQIHSKAAIPVLLENLTAKPSSSDQYTVNTLGQIATSLNAGEFRQKILSALIKRLDDSQPAEIDLKAAIVDNLGRMKAREITPHLLEMLRSLGTSGQQTRGLNDNKVLQTALIRTLGDLVDDQGDEKEGLLLDYFSQLVTDKNTDISLQTEAMLALARINPASPKTRKIIQSISVIPLSSNADQGPEHIPNGNLYLAQIMLESDSKTRNTLIEKLITAVNQPEDRMMLANALSRIPTDWSMEGLLILADDKDIKVKKLAIGAIRFILYENKALIAPLLTESDQKPEFRSAAIRALGKLASNQAARVEDNESTTQLKAIATNLDTPVADRAIALSVLNDRSGDDIPSILLDVMKEDTGDLSSSGFFYLTVANKNSPAALAYLKSQLKVIDQQYAQYRKQRDSLVEDSDNTESVTPPEFPWQFQIASAIASMSPEDGIALLSHNLARVRYGAVSGLQSQGDIKLLKKLITLYKSRKQSLASFAAYRVIDETLKVIQNHGNTDNLETELTELGSMQRMTRGLDGVHARLEWTINQLADKQTRQSRTVSG